MEPHDELHASSLNTGRLVATFMAVAGGLLALVGTIWGLVELWGLTHAPQPTFALFVRALALLLGSWAAGLFLWGAAEMLRRLEDLLDARLSGMGAPGPVLPGPRPRNDNVADRQTRLLEQLTRLTQEVRDISLMTDAERAARVELEAVEVAEALERDVPNLLREHNWLEARRRVQRARARFPATGNWNALEKQVEEARAAVESRDVAAVTREVGDLTSLGAWDRAMQAALDLQNRHPDSPQATELVRRVGGERNKAAADERSRLMAQAQSAKDGRNWPETLRLVNAVLEKYPNSPEATELRQQLPTLQANVEIQMRQRMEAEIREAVRARRYAEAFALATELIDRYPDSPQAAVLREQLPKIQAQLRPRR